MGRKRRAWPGDFLDEVRAANGPTKRQIEAHERDMQAQARLVAQQKKDEKS